MLAVHIVGAIVAAIGLILFAADQWTAGQKGKEGTAGLTAWKIELGGPPALILIVIGLAVFLYPYWAGRDQPATTTTTTTTLSTTTTTASNPTVVVDPTFHTFMFPPPAPTWWEIGWDDSFCGSETIYWEDTGAEYWIVPVAAIIDGDIRALEFEVESGLPFLCDWEFVQEGYTRYWLWPTPWNEAGPGEFLWIEYEVMP